MTWFFVGLGLGIALTIGVVVWLCMNPPTSILPW